MGKHARRVRNLGLLFEAYAGAQRPVFHLSRPFDIAPGAGTRHTVDDLALLVAQTSGALRAAGLRSGDRLGIVKANHFDVVLLAAAAARIGVLPALISDTVPPESLRIMLGRLEPTVLLAGADVLARAQSAGIALTGPGVRTVRIGGDGEGPAGTVGFDELGGAAVPPAAPHADDKPMICTHTSGTTGVPKLVVHSANTLGGVLTRLETMRIPFLSTRPDDTITACIAFVHGRSAVWAFAQLGLPPAKAVVLADSRPDAVIPTLAEHPPTTLEACPNIFQRWEELADRRPELFARVRAFINTFDLIHPRSVRKFLGASQRRGAVWGQSWGQTEAGPVTLAVYTRRTIRKSDGDPLTNDVGRPIPFVTRLRVVDPETRRPVRRGREGIVLVRTKGRCLTYLGEPERHAEKIWDGYWNTGDIGRRTRSGKIYLVDREVDVIPGTSGISLESMLLERLPDVTEAIVLGVPGGKPVPIVGTASGRLDPADWARATAGLPALAEPIVIDWEDFPRTGTWKVIRPALRERYLKTTETFGSGQWT
jgi:acyl-coenzyme A synthetase/AMP-(fatty) acid ligase